MYKGKTEIEDQISFFNILRNRKIKNGNDFKNSVVQSRGKAKNKTETARIPFSM